MINHLFLLKWSPDPIAISSGGAKKLRVLEDEYFARV